jgi:hypothetical protein
MRKETTKRTNLIRLTLAFVGALGLLATGGDRAEGLCVGNPNCLQCDINQYCVWEAPPGYCSCRQYWNGCAAWTYCSYR